jgi:hypothetical protein
VARLRHRHRRWADLETEDQGTGHSKDQPGEQREYHPTGRSTYKPDDHRHYNPKTTLTTFRT